MPLLGPVADKLGIDLIWFGVLLGVNMQTSFMHPPFGFALFYLRSVAPAKEYVDKVTKLRRWRRSPPGRSTGVRCRTSCIQVIMVALVIVFPQMVMVYKATLPQVDPSKIEINIPAWTPGPRRQRPGRPRASRAKAARRKAASRSRT